MSYPPVQGVSSQKSYPARRHPRERDREPFGSYLLRCNRSTMTQFNALDIPEITKLTSTRPGAQPSPATTNAGEQQRRGSRNSSLCAITCPSARRSPSRSNKVCTGSRINAFSLCSRLSGERSSTRR